VSAELSARRTAAAAVTADFRHEADRYIDAGGPRPDFSAWAWRLHTELRLVLDRLEDEKPTAKPEPEPAKLAAIREVLAHWDADSMGARETVGRIEDIADATGTATGPELSGGAYISAADLGTILDALIVAADHKRGIAAYCADCDQADSDLCPDCDTRLDGAGQSGELAERLGGGS
jgi:hypothetical protein